MPMSPRLLRPRATSALVAADADARAYINAVRTADGGQYMEAGVQRAIDAFVVGCKADGIWSAIKASCILMGARTLNGALTPLAGAAPTNNGPFVSGDYNRKTGLIGNATTKYLDTNRTDSADGIADAHLSCYMSSVSTQFARQWVGSTSWQAIGVNGGLNFGFVNFRGFQNLNTNAVPSGFTGVSIASTAANGITYRSAGSEIQTTTQNLGAAGRSYFLYGRRTGNTPFGPTEIGDWRLAFYSIGSSVTLATLDSRVTALYNAIGAAIP